MEHPITWFEIPVVDIERAVKFYNAVIDGECGEIRDGGIRKMAVLPYGMVAGGGSLVQTEGFVPGSDGIVIYLPGGDDLQVMLDRVEPAGGTITRPKARIDMGYIGIFTDSEGNTVGLFSQN
ncbi:MAG: VOC family protein [Chloroflexota bacterium]